MVTDAELEAEIERRLSRLESAEDELNKEDVNMLHGPPSRGSGIAISFEDDALAELMKFSQQNVNTLEQYYDELQVNPIDKYSGALKVSQIQEELDEETEEWKTIKVQ
jgi:hypothetical protein